MMFALYLLSGAVYVIACLTLTESGDRWWAMCRSGAANRHGGDRFVWVTRTITLLVVLIVFWPPLVFVHFLAWLFGFFANSSESRRG